MEIVRAHDDPRHRSSHWERPDLRLAEEILGPRALLPDAGSVWNLRRPLLAWLITLSGAHRLAEMGTSPDGAFLSMCEAVSVLGLDASCAAIGSGRSRGGFGPSGQDSRQPQAASPLGSSAPFVCIDDPLAVSELVKSCDFLHLNAATIASFEHSLLERWLADLQPGGVVVMTALAGTDTEESVWTRVGEHLPTFVDPRLRLAVGQVPDVDGAPVVETLEKAEPIVLAVLALLAERGEYRHVLEGEALPPSELRLEIQEREQQARRDRMKQLETENTLRHDLARALAEIEQVQREFEIERTRLSADYRDSLEMMAAKVAATASRCEAEVERITAASAAELEGVEALLGGKLEDAQARVAELEASTSWRLTAGLRWMSRVMKLLGDGASRHK